MFAKIVLVAISLVTAGFGLLAFVSPEAFAGAMSMELAAPGAVTEVRAFYGGLEIGLAIFWMMGALQPRYLQPALVSVLLVWGAVALARTLGIVMDGSISNMMLAALGLEVAAVIAASIALKQYRPNRLL